MSDLAIKVENISKLYQLGTIGTGTLNRDLQRWYANIMGKEDPFRKVGQVNDRSKKATSDFVWALKDIDFEVKKGEVMGIIGRNGAGKSTLLKILSKITSPTSGKIIVNGRIASLLEVGTGFHPELTGRENIFMNGAILGMRKWEIEKKFDEIVDFSGVEAYIDTPVKRYSSGMYVRLAFAVAAFLEPEILIVDEVLAVGDVEFQKKCLGRMKNVSETDGRTVLFVSHNLGAIQNLCDSLLLLDNGSVNAIGNVKEVISKYQSNFSPGNSQLEFRLSEKSKIKSINLTDSEGKPTTSFIHNQAIYLTVEIGDFDLSDCFLLLTFQSHLAINIFSAETKIYKNKLVLVVDAESFTRGFYSIKIIIYKPGVEKIEVIQECCSFEIVDGGSSFSHLESFDYGLVYGKYKWI